MDFLLTPWMKKYMYNILRSLPFNLQTFKNLAAAEFWNFSTKKELKAIAKPVDINERPEINNELTLLWLDDRINPLEIRMDWLAYSPIGRNVNVIWVKNYIDFKNWVENNGLPDAICFDDDLGEKNQNGYDCAKWLVDYCQKKQLSIPSWASQSTNPEGKIHINRILRNYLNGF